MVLFEEKFVFFPSTFPEGNWKPQTYGLDPEECYFATPDGLQLHGWFFAADSARGTLLWCHGNAGNITHRLDNVSKLLPLRLNVFIFDYRGYGRSQGTPSEIGIYEDAVAAYDYLTQERGVDPSLVILFGRSLGAIAAIHIATKKACRGLIVESGFTSAKEMAKELFPFLPVHHLIRTKLDAMSMISDVHVPLLFAHGTEDRTVPIRLGMKLFEHANEPKSFYEIVGADHNDTYIVGGKGYFARLDDFVSETLSTPR